jgi:O-antigen/teichoic acid export membrane protein
VRESESGHSVPTAVDGPTEQSGDRSALTKRVTGGLLWMYLGTGATLVIQTAVLVVLARLVTPADFGLMAAALVMTSFGGLLAQAGLDTALVQREHLTDLHVRTAFGASLALSTLLAVAVFFAAPRLAAVYRLPEITPLIRVLCVVFVIEGLTLGEHLLLRELRFRPVAMIGVVSFGLGYGLVSIVLAARGWGVWALVGGHIAQAVIATIGFWLLRPHPIMPALRPKELADLFRVGAGETLARLIGMVGAQGDAFIVGRWLGAAALGFYGRAYRLMELPTTLFSQAIRKVMFPAMASFQSDRERLGRTYLTGVGVMAAATLPVSVVLALIAPEFVDLLLGGQWDALVPVFQVLVFGMLFRASPAVSDSLILACGAVYRQAGRIALFATLVLAGAWIGQHWGLTGVAAGILLAMASNYVLMAYISLSLTGVPWRRYWSAQLPALVLTAGVALTVVPTIVLLRTADAPSLVAVLVTGLVAGLTELGLVRLAPLLGGLGGLEELVRRVLAVLPGGARRSLHRLTGLRQAA